MHLRGNASPEPKITTSSRRKGKKKNKTAAGVGGGVGGAVAIALVGAVLDFLRRRRNRKRAAATREIKEGEEEDLGVYPAPMCEADGTAQAEVVGQEKPAELPDGEKFPEKSQELQGHAVAQHELR
ncbi:MAG: hypothetical protein Q9219_007489 [cf. Caloplaca sp. 3 TL-2023]